MTVTDSLQQALAIEHQVIYGYGVLGAHLSGRDAITDGPVTQQQAAARLDQHKVLRDRLAALLRSRHQQPTPAAAAYALPFPVTNETEAAHLGQTLERAAAQSAYAVIAQATRSSAERRLMIAALAEAATWEGQWTIAIPEPFAWAFPGQPAASQPSTTPTSSPS